MFDFFTDSGDFLFLGDFSCDAASFFPFACCINEKEETFTDVPGGTFGPLSLDVDDVGDVGSELGDRCPWYLFEVGIRWGVVVEDVLLTSR